MGNELRRDYFLDRYVIIAAGRGKRPTDYKHDSAAVKDEGKKCFFCPGNEDTTPPEISRIEEGGDWVIRVFPNKFPAVTQDDFEVSDGAQPAYGSHDIVVESPVHGQTIADVSVSRLSDVLRVYGERVKTMLADPKVEYALVFKNHGKAAGASLSHTHTQIVSVPLVPQAVRNEVEAAKRYSIDNGRCPICDAATNESGGPRAIWEDEHAIAFAPYASRSPFEAWVTPKSHVVDFEGLDEATRNSMAQGLMHLVKRLKEGLSDPPYNLYFHVSPQGEDLHLHAELLPRLSTWAGFEIGSGIIINTMPPEQAAEFYRQTEP